MKNRIIELKKEIEDYDTKIDRLNELNEEVTSDEEEQERKELMNWWTETYKGCLQAELKGRISREREIIEIIENWWGEYKESYYISHEYLKELISKIKGTE